MPFAVLIAPHKISDWMTRAASSHFLVIASHNLVFDDGAIFLNEPIGQKGASNAGTGATPKRGNAQTYGWGKGEEGGQVDR